jgi:hypothetical protein
MKRIPETFELSEEDIKQAIAYWLEDVVCVENDANPFNITFSVDRVAVAPPPGAPVGGMSDFTKQVITAKVVKE